MDLILLDRDVERSAWRLVKAREELDEGKTPASPFERERHAASRATVVSLLALAPSLLDVPQRDALAAWIAHLTVERVVFDRTSALAEALSEEAVRVRESADDEDLTSKATWMRMMRRPLRAREPLFDALVVRARALDGRAIELLSAREEAYLQMNQPLATGGADGFQGAVRAFARELLLRTDALARSFVTRREQREGVDVAPFTSAFDLAQATDATEGWPQSLTTRWLQGLFPAASTFERPFSLNLAVNGASYLRGFERFGTALVDRAKTRSFASLVSPFGLERSAMGAVFGVLPTRPMFLRRSLELGAISAERQAKVLETALLFELRRRALSVLARQREELDPYIEGSRGGLEPLYRLMRPLSIDAESRLVGMLFLADFEERLQERFDEDWFRNPRIGPLLREPLTSGVLFRGALEEKSAKDWANRLAHAFEMSLG